MRQLSGRLPAAASSRPDAMHSSAADWLSTSAGWGSGPPAHLKSDPTRPARIVALTSVALRVAATSVRWFCRLTLRRRRSASSPLHSPCSGVLTRRQVAIAMALAGNPETGVGPRTPRLRRTPEPPRPSLFPHLRQGWWGGTDSGFAERSRDPSGPASSLTPVRASRTRLPACQAGGKCARSLSAAPTRGIHRLGRWCRGCGELSSGRRGWDGFLLRAATTRAGGLGDACTAPAAQARGASPCHQAAPFRLGRGSISPATGHRMRGEQGGTQTPVFGRSRRANRAQRASADRLCEPLHTRRQVDPKIASNPPGTRTGPSGFGERNPRLVSANARSAQRG